MSPFKTREELLLEIEDLKKHIKHLEAQRFRTLDSKDFLDRGAWMAKIKEDLRRIKWVLPKWFIREYEI